MKIKKTNDKNINTFIEASMEASNPLADLFSYGGFASDNYEARINHIKNNNKSEEGSLWGKYLGREVLVPVLESYQRELAGISKKEIPLQLRKNLDNLKAGALTLVTGQQAGLFTGPLYTINKVISLIKHAKELERKNGQAVIPVFWVASEDHDIDEIDHVYINNREGLRRLSIPWKQAPNRSASKVGLSSEMLAKLELQVNSSLIDSPFKQEISKKILNYYRASSLSTAFAAFLYDLFADFGLVIFDADSPEIRREEGDLFKQIIKNDRSIIDKIEKAIADIESLGYRALVTNEDKKIGLFLNWDEERRPIRWRDGHFTIADRTLSKEDLLALIEERPEDFSSNVLIRPLVQEYLFQPISYLAGQAEFQYWAQLKPLFEFFNYKMPLVELRNSYTIVTEEAMSIINDYELNIDEILKGNKVYIDNIYNQEFNDLAFELDKNFLEKEFSLIIDKYYMEIGNNKLANNVIIEEKYTLMNNLLKTVEKSNKHLLLENRKVNKDKRTDIVWIINELFPRQGKQERTLNIVSYINRYGYSAITDILNSIIEDDHKMDGKHYSIEL